MTSNSKNNNLTVGLDIGTTKICAIAVEGDDIEALNVVGVGTAKSDGLRKGVVVNIEKTVKAIKKAVEECELMCGARFVPSLLALQDIISGDKTAEVWSLFIITVLLLMKTYVVSLTQPKY